MVSSLSNLLKGSSVPPQPESVVSGGPCRCPYRLIHTTPAPTTLTGRHTEPSTDLRGSKCQIKTRFSATECGEQLVVNHFGPVQKGRDLHGGRASYWSHVGHGRGDRTRRVTSSQSKGPLCVCPFLNCVNPSLETLFRSFNVGRGRKSLARGETVVVYVGAGAMGSRGTRGETLGGVND